MRERVWLWSAVWLLGSCHVYDAGRLSPGLSRERTPDGGDDASRPAADGGADPKPSLDAGRDAHRDRRDASDVPKAGHGGTGPMPPSSEPEDADGGSGGPLSPDAGTDAGTTGSGACSEPGGRVWSDNGHCYFALASAASWNSAREACAHRGAALASITSRAERVFTEQLIHERPHWIGLSKTRSSRFAWLTGEPVAYTHWERNAPRVFGPSAVAIRNGTRLWFDDVFDESYAALCERP